MCVLYAKMVVNAITIVFALNVCVLCLGSVRDGWPGYNHYPELNGWLKVHPEPADWRTARANCHREKALLVGPWTTEFKTAIHNIQSKMYPTGSDMYSSAGLRVGSPDLPRQPCASKRCNVFLASGVMGKVKCDRRLPYACFAPISTCGHGYTFEKQTGKCYKFHNDAQTWPIAQRVCYEEGANIAKIDSPAELKVLLALNSGLTYIQNDNGGDQLRHLSDNLSSPYSDYSCSASHSFICEQNLVSDLRD